MIKKTIKYVDYNGNNREEDFYFDFNESEIAEMYVSVDGGLKAYIEKIVKADNQAEIIRLFKKLVLDAYGEKSDDGRRFIKSEELSTAFSQTPAYNKIFMELATDDKKAAEFVNGIIPQIE